MLCRPPRSPGSYVLLVEVHAPIALRIDKRGSRVVALLPGCYAYVGSAWGPGGLAARLARHFEGRRRRLHWHIDRLLESGYATPVCYLAAPGCRGERSIASCLSQVLEGVEGFGATDDPFHGTHLFLAGSTCDQAMLERVGRCLTRACPGSRLSWCCK